VFTYMAETPPQKRRTRTRRLVLVDIENMVGGAVQDSESVIWAKQQFDSLVDLRPGDHVVVGTSHIGLLETGCNWPHARYVIRSGPDGADLALLEVLEENVAARYGEVVIVSGDGIFTQKVADLASRGLHVTVIAHPDGLAARLRLAAQQTTYLPHRHQPQCKDAA
jgi:NYN domain